MSLWQMLSIGVILFSGLSMIFLVSRFGKFNLVRRIAGERRSVRIVLSIALTAALTALLYYLTDFINMMICLLHIVVIWILCDVLCAVVRRIRKGISGKPEEAVLPSPGTLGYQYGGKRRLRIYTAGICAILFSAAWLGYAWYTAHHVIRTEYTVETEKDLGGKPYRIAMFADSHIGATFHSWEFAEYIQEIELAQPDALVIVGDFVDDDTDIEDMKACCRALREISIKDGIYFVYGNHDRGYYPAAYRGYDGAVLEEELEKNGVTVLKDESLVLDGRLTLIGREDARYLTRASMEELLERLPSRETDPEGAEAASETFRVVLDHEPHDYAAQEKSGVDLVLSGHTHGGWLFPFNRYSEIMGIDDKVYGMEKRSDTTFIVTSGISEWALKFRTGCVAEWVLITVE